MSIIRRLAQGLLSATFIYGGVDIFRNPGPRAARAEALGLPRSELGVQLNAATMVIAGSALALDIAPRLAAAALTASLIPTTIIGHPFWRETAQAGRKAQLTQFNKNAGLLGGLLLVLASSPAETPDK
jgi:putative oxidoreductase